MLKAALAVDLRNLPNEELALTSLGGGDIIAIPGRQNCS
jgi:hypothetical protein